MGGIKVFFYLIFHSVNFGLGTSNDELYKKFIQNDYKIFYEREVTTYVNESYLEFSMLTFKYNRTHFATNSSCIFKKYIGYDLEVIVQGYKFLSNEYRIFPIHFEYNYCKALKHNMAGVNYCQEKCGYLSCPLNKDIHYFVCNCILDESKLPPFIPSGKFKFVLEGRHKNNIVVITEVYFSVFRPILPK